MGQSASSIHSERHCLGLALYGALAVAYDQLGTEVPWDQIEQAATIEYGHMLEALRKVAIKNEPNPATFKWKIGETDEKKAH